MKKGLLLSIFTSTLLYANGVETSKLETIVYSATKTEQLIKNVTSNIDIITNEEIEEKHISTVSDVLNLLSGVNFTRNGGIGKSTALFLRGFDSKRSLILIDGIRYNDISGLNGASIEHLTVGNIERIEVIKGAQSGIWGADASAGVINIITKTPKDAFEFNYDFQSGSFHTHLYNLNLGGAKDNFFYQVNFGQLNTKGFSSYSKSGDNLKDYEDDGYKNKTLNLKFGYKFNEANKIDLNHNIIESYVEYDGPKGDTTNYSTGKNHFSSINFENINSLGVTKVFFKNSKFDRDYPLGFVKEYDASVKEYGLIHTTKYLNESSFLTSGVEYKSFEHKNAISKDYSNKALFLTNSNSFKETTISESIRFDEYNSFNNRTTGKIGIKHNLNESFSIFTNYGEAYNIPTLYQLYAPNYGNKNLNSESTKSYDIGFDYKNIKITYFYNIIEDMIDFNLDSWEYYNEEGKSKFKGFEIDYSKEVFKDTLLSLNYTYLNAKNSVNQNLARRPKDTLKYSIDYYGINKLHLNLNGEYIGERFNDENSGGEQTGKYFLIGMNINYDINENFKLYAKIENLTDKYYQVVSNYASSPRAYYVGIKGKF